MDRVGSLYTGWLLDIADNTSAMSCFHFGKGCLKSIDKVAHIACICLQHDMLGRLCEAVLSSNIIAAHAQLSSTL
jgi:hypothetical protein